MHCQQISALGIISKTPSTLFRKPCTKQVNYPLLTVSIILTSSMSSVKESNKLSDIDMAEQENTVKENNITNEQFEALNEKVTQMQHMFLASQQPNPYNQQM